MRFDKKFSAGSLAVALSLSGLAVGAAGCAGTQKPDAGAMKGEEHSCGGDMKGKDHSCGGDMKKDMAAPATGGAQSLGDAMKMQAAAPASDADNTGK